MALHVCQVGIQRHGCGIRGVDAGPAVRGGWLGQGEHLDEQIAEVVAAIRVVQCAAYIGDEVVVAERPHGAYTRQIFLGDTLDSEHLQANCEHGVLTLTIPVAATAKPRRVQVGGSADAQTIEPQTAGGT